jgi:glutathionyl-hydroquinone reductase
MQIFDTAVAALHTTLDVYEVILGEHIFLVGDARAFFTPMYPPSDWRMTL